jgi:hypothetical protein
MKRQICQAEILVFILVEECQVFSEGEIFATIPDYIIPYHAMRAWLCVTHENMSKLTLEDSLYWMSVEFGKSCSGLLLDHVSQF